MSTAMGMSTATAITTALPTSLTSPEASSTAWGMVSKPHIKKGAEVMMARIPPKMLLWLASLTFS